jgi:ParB-like chromosome segregation protein Spo0J
VTRVALADLTEGYTPRATRIDEGHVKTLSEVIDRVPPILVERRTMQVLDGLHRVQAARRSGRTHIDAILFSGDESEALALAVEANVKHGKPLSRAERQTAAIELLRRLPERSDRWLAEVCGLSHSTVGKLRNELEQPRLTSRVGRDGRRRPVDPAASRAAAAREISSRPEATLRQVAASAGVAVSTAQRVSLGVRRSAVQATTTAMISDPLSDEEQPSVLDAPALRSRPDLDEFRTWLSRTEVSSQDFQMFLEQVPLGRIYELVDEFRKRSQVWLDIARELEKRAQRRPYQPI